MNNGDDILSSTDWIPYWIEADPRIPDLLFSRLELRWVRFLKGNGVLEEDFFEEVFEVAWKKGTISDEEWKEVWHPSNNLLRSQSREDQSLVYATVRLAATIQDLHFMQASAWSDVVQRVTGERAIPVVMGARIKDTHRQLAEEMGVVLIHVSFEDVGLIDTSRVNI